jgi:hypothetical protein
MTEVLVGAASFVEGRLVEGTVRPEPSGCGDVRTSGAR